MIVHFMVLQLNYAAASSFFFSLLVECVNFDILPIDEIHAYFFDFYNAAWST